MNGLVPQVRAPFYASIQPLLGCRGANLGGPSHRELYLRHSVNRPRLARLRLRGTCGTQSKSGHHSLNALEGNGGDDGTRTRGLCRDSSPSNNGKSENE